MCIVKKIKIVSDDDKLSISRYLNEEYTYNGKKCKSSYLAALWHARIATGRNKFSGVVENQDQLGDWSGACMYFIVIEHLGGMFRNVDIPGIENVGDMKGALMSFTDLNKKEIDILKQLRNSFVHKFNLYDVPYHIKKSSSVVRLFSVNRDDDELIKFPVTEIDCSFDEIIEAKTIKQNTTTISLKLLGDLVEKMHGKILSLLHESKLEILLKYSDELENFLALNSIIY